MTYNERILIVADEVEPTETAHPSLDQTYLTHSCEACGALIRDTAVHDAWHTKMEFLAASATKPTPVHRCRVCDQHRETRRVRKFGGGNQSRMGYWRKAHICSACAWFAMGDPEGYDEQGNLWSIDGLREAWPWTEEK